MANGQCTFCEIAARRTQAEVIFEDATSVAFLDHRPLFHGHVLLAPLEHCETLVELPDATLPRFFANARLLAAAVQGGMGADGTFVAINNRVSQSVPHLHVHIVPRRRGDGLRGFFWPRHPYRDDAHREQVGAQIRQAVEALQDAGDSK